MVNDQSLKSDLLVNPKILILEKQWANEFKIKLTSEATANLFVKTRTGHSKSLLKR
jgi:hypothetical protein